jgi:hypothetical protein
MRNECTPSKEWENFKTNCLVKHGMTEHEIRTYKLVFWGALAAATAFYVELITGDASSEDKQQMYEDWIADLNEGVSATEVEVLNLFGRVNGRDN